MKNLAAIDEAKDLVTKEWIESQNYIYLINGIAGVQSQIDNLRQWIENPVAEDIQVGRINVTDNINFLGYDFGVSSGHLQFNSKLLLDSANYSSYALPLSGGTLTGNLTVNANISTSGSITATGAISSYSGFKISGATDNSVLLAGGGNAAISSLSVGNADTVDSKHASDFTDYYSWNAVIKGQTWSRICKIVSNHSVTGSAIIINIRATRDSVVYNNSYVLNVSHAAGYGSLSQIAGTDYSAVKIRVYSSNTAAYFIEIYDDAYNITSSTSQTVSCSIIPITSNITLTKYTEFTDGTTPESGYSLVAEITSTSGVDIITKSITATTFTGALTGNASTATTLKNSKTIWGQSFDGSANVSGAISGATSISASGDISTSAGLLKTSSNSNTLTIGSQNSAYCHFENSANVPFYFNRPIYVNGGLFPYTSVAYDLGSSDKKWNAVYTGALITDAVGSSLTPGLNETHSLGTSSFQWNNIYGKTIYENGTSLSNKYAAASHTHSYLPLSGGTLSGNLSLYSTSGASPNLYFWRNGGTDFRVCVDTGNFCIIEGSQSSNTSFTDTAVALKIFESSQGSYATIYGNKVYTAGNSNNTSTSWTASSLTLAGALSGATTGSFGSNVTIGGTLAVTGKISTSNKIEATQAITSHAGFIYSGMTNDSVLLAGGGTENITNIYRAITSFSGRIEPIEAWLNDPVAEDFLVDTLNVTRGINLKGIDLLASGTSVVPSVTNTYSFGSDSLRWANLYAVNGAFSGATTFTGASTFSTGINLTEAKYIQFRPNNGSYYTTLRYDTTGNEALILGMKNAVTSFIVKSGDSGTTATTTIGWTSLTPSIQVKGQSLYVNDLIANGVTPSYNFKVNGTSLLGGATYVSGDLCPLTTESYNLGTSSFTWSSVYTKVLYADRSGSSFIPANNTTCDLGSSSNGWQNLYLEKNISAANYDAIDIAYNGSWASYTDYLAGVKVSDGTGVVGRFGITYDSSVGGEFKVQDLYKSGYGASGVVFTIDSNGSTYIKSSLNFSNTSGSFINYNDVGTALGMTSTDYCVGYGYCSESKDGYIDGNNLHFRTSSSHTDNMIINSSGNVGIGTTSPSFKLHVAGTIGATGKISTSDAIESSNSTVTAKNGFVYSGLTNDCVLLAGGGYAAISSLIKEENLEWGGKSWYNNVSPIGMSLCSQLSANRLAYINPDAITYEYSSDGGSSWSNYSYTGYYKNQIFLDGAGLSIPIGRTDDTTEYTTSSRTRITITACDGTYTYVYTNPKKLLIKVATSGGMQVLVETRTGANYQSGGAWTTFGTYTLSGWAGWNDIPLILETLGGGTNQTSNNWQLRLTFVMTTKSSTYPKQAEVDAIRLFGENDWVTSNNLARTGHIYDIDTTQSVYFPKSIYSTDSIYPTSNGGANLGGSAQRWSGIYGVNAYFTSDGSFSGNVYLDNNWIQMGTVVTDSLDPGIKFQPANSRFAHIESLNELDIHTYDSTGASNAYQLFLAKDGGIGVGYPSSNSCKLYVNGTARVASTFTADSYLYTAESLIFTNASSAYISFQSVGTVLEMGTASYMLGHGYSQQGKDGYIEGNSLHFRTGTSHTLAMSINTDQSVSICGNLYASSNEPLSIGTSSGPWNSLYVNYINGEYPVTSDTTSGIKHIKKLTQAEYDALSTKATDTLYIIC